MRRRRRAPPLRANPGPLSAGEWFAVLALGGVAVGGLVYAFKPAAAATPAKSPALAAASTTTPSATPTPAKPPAPPVTTPAAAVPASAQSAIDAVALFSGVQTLIADLNANTLSAADQTLLSSLTYANLHNLPTATVAALQLAIATYVSKDLFTPALGPLEAVQTAAGDVLAAG
jgi:hypothetical protein